MMRLISNITITSSLLLMEKSHQLRGMHSRGIGLQADLTEVDANGLKDGPSIIGNDLIDLSIFVHEVAAFSELALVLIIEDLAATGAVKLAVAVGILGPQFFYSMGEPASVLIGTISLFHKVFAEFHLDLALTGLVPLRRSKTLALAGIEGVAVLLVLFSILPFVGRDGDGRDRVKGSVSRGFSVSYGMALALGRLAGFGLGLTDLLRHIGNGFRSNIIIAVNVFPFNYSENDSKRCGKCDRQEPVWGHVLRGNSAFAQLRG